MDQDLLGVLMTGNNCPDIKVTRVGRICTLTFEADTSFFDSDYGMPSMGGRVVEIQAPTQWMIKQLQMVMKALKTGSSE
jgi:hypothetical protein